MGSVAGASGASGGGGVSNSGPDLQGLSQEFDRAAAMATEQRKISISGQAKVNAAREKVNS